MADAPTSDIGQIYQQILASKGMQPTADNMRQVGLYLQREPGIANGEQSAMQPGLMVQQMSAPPPNVAQAQVHGGAPGPMPMPMPTTMGGGMNVPAPSGPVTNPPVHQGGAPAQPLQPIPPQAQPQPAQGGPTLDMGPQQPPAATTPPPGQPPSPAQIAQAAMTRTPIMQSPANMTPVDISGGVPRPMGSSAGIPSESTLLRPNSFKQMTSQEYAGIDPLTGQPKQVPSVAQAPTTSVARAIEQPTATSPIGNPFAQNNQSGPTYDMDSVGAGVTSAALLGAGGIAGKYAIDQRNQPPAPGRGPPMDEHLFPPGSARTANPATEDIGNILRGRPTNAPTTFAEGATPTPMRAGEGADPYLGKPGSATYPTEDARKLKAEQAKIPVERGGSYAEGHDPMQKPNSQLGEGVDPLQRSLSKSVGESPGVTYPTEDARKAAAEAEAEKALSRRMRGGTKRLRL